MGWIRITNKEGQLIYATEEAPDRYPTSTPEHGYDSQGNPQGRLIEDFIEVDHLTRLKVRMLIEEGKRKRGQKV